MEPDDVARAAWPHPGAAPETPAAAPPPEAEELAHAPAEPDSHTRAAQPPPSTNDPAVDSAAAEAAAALTEPLEAQLAAYERAHRTLQDRLADVEG